MPELFTRLNDFDAALRTALMAACTEGPPRLKEALNYAVLGGGKRIRPQLCFAAGQVWQVPIGKIIPVAVAVELIHAQSLVHDDLPCMDNDDERRGQPTVHKAYDECTAVLVGDALLAHAFAVLAKPHPDLTPDQQARLVFELSHVYQQLVSGQVMDVIHQLEPSSSTAMEDAINRLKTAVLFRFCFWSVGYLAQLPAAQLMQWAEIGEQTGLLFQRCDDWYDTDWADNETARRASAAEQIYALLENLRQDCNTLHPQASSVLRLLDKVLPPSSYCIN